jgi:hypothetical protein
MAEALGVVASGIAVAQLAGQLVATTQKLYTFWVGLKGAPKQVGDALREVALLGKIISELEMKENEDLERKGREVVMEALTYCGEVMSELEDFLAALKRNIASTGAGKRQWNSFKVLLKSQVLSELERKLERAKSMLGLAVECYSL